MDRGEFGLAALGDERRVTADARRDRKLERDGHRVVLVQAELVTRDLPAALRAILQALREH